jgi:hypothetical protein
LNDHDLTPSGNVKPYARLIGADRHTLNLLSIATRALKNNGLKQDANDLEGKVLRSQSPDEALMHIMTYVHDESMADNEDPDG